MAERHLSEPPLMDIERPAGVPARRAGPAFGSDLVVDLLHALGYRYLPMNPGSSFRGLHDSVVNHGGNAAPQLLLCLHEEIAVALAHGYAKARGGPAAAAVHDLVGLMHASMAVYDAYADRAPVLLLGGSGPADPAARRPTDWLHSATSQAELVRPYVKWDDEPATPEAFVHGVVRAHRLAHSAPAGPVYVSLDAAVQEQRLAGPQPLPDLARHAPAPRLFPDPACVQAAARLLAGARLPVVVGGRVGLDPAATALLCRLVETLGAAYLDDKNLVAFPTAHPANCTGDDRLLREADVILAVDVVDLPGLLADHGRRDRSAPAPTAPATDTPATEAPLPAIVDLSAGDLGARPWSNAFAAPLPRTVQLLADPLVGLAALIDAVDGRRPREAVARSADEARTRRAAVHERADAHLRAHWSDSPISPGRLVAETWAAVQGIDRLLTLRNTRSWPVGGWEFGGAGEYLGHSGGGGVGYGPGAMVGGALAARDRGQLGVAIVADGDLLMASGALWTAAHYRIPMLVVVNDNGSFYNDELHQARVARQRGRPAVNSWIGMRIGDPAVDVAGLAASYGCAAHGPIEDPDKLPAVLRAATADAAAGAVAVVHVRTARG